MRIAAEASPKRFEQWMYHYGYFVAGHPRPFIALPGLPVTPTPGKANPGKGSGTTADKSDSPFSGQVPR